ncbi:MAG TPA: NmrA/HSCARG family protein [Flavisolibacter sp.]|nr:NmrA/HSCARG family protein [Flavisolibacter sp.]
MDRAQTIFVTGATGNQGGAVARNLLSNGFRVKLLTRHPDSRKAQQLQHPFAEVIKGDLNEPDSYSQHLKHAQGVFSVQAIEPGREKEMWQGITLADRAKDAGISHFVYSSVAGADQNTGIPHWETKAVIEEHIRKSGLSYTILRPVSLFENFLIPQVKARILKGKLITPAKKNIQQQFIAAEDIGRMTARIFKNPQTFKNRTITLASEEMTMEDAAEIFSGVLGKKITYAQLPGLMTKLFMGNGLYKMFDYINHHDSHLVKDLNALKNENPGLLTLKEWISLYFR